ncbi:hypothetical protein HCH_02933 [Hahella chejuensis KCTC 2396]|uniref:Uncharacterized protein n=1 Tax=Hahella chejuensis (strain KCTC 2396) TaxID=349521 RepID=Q2SI19_HAHCH|nr:hypothetical protein HCH_02933 [Hahella chejuensis KCTC 2396]
MRRGFYPAGDIQELFIDVKKIKKKECAQTNQLSLFECNA